MQPDPTSRTSAQTDTWNNPASFGFSSWQRHTGVSLGDGNSRGFRNISAGDDQRGLRAIYDRHASFASNLIARRYQQAESEADIGRFIHASPMSKQRYSYRSVQSEPSLLQREAYPKQYHDLASGPTASPGGNGIMSKALASKSFGTTTSLRDDQRSPFSPLASDAKD